PAAYPFMGFEEFLSIETMPFEKSDYVREYVSDTAFYPYLAQLADRYSQKLFLFAVTMQTHGGYTWQEERDNTGQQPFDEEISLLPPQGDYPELEQYANLLRLSDKALEGLVNHYAHSNEKVVIVQFGDHWPAIKDGFTEEMIHLVGEERFPWIVQQTPYVIWANYPLKTPTGNTDLLSVNYFSLLIKQATGLPMTGFDCYLQKLWDQYPVISIQGVLDREGKPVSKEDFFQEEVAKDYSVFQFNNFTGKGGYMENLYWKEKTGDHE
ncbi:MAG: sulfatase-like hydrolase/transferase, partial [Clostridiales bacterium]|nr:sulfatase-like hydrolase/transferase [Clostridiales bacterium]